MPASQGWLPARNRARCRQPNTTWGQPPAARRRLANGTAIAAALVGVPFLAAFVFLAAGHHLSAFGGIAWSLVGALGLPALAVTAAEWCWRRLSRARRQPRPPGFPPAPG